MAHRRTGTPIPYPPLDATPDAVQLRIYEMLDHTDPYIMDPCVTADQTQGERVLSLDVYCTARGASAVPSCGGQRVVRYVRAEDGQPRRPSRHPAKPTRPVPDAEAWSGRDGRRSRLPGKRSAALLCAIAFLLAAIGLADVDPARLPWHLAGLETKELQLEGIFVHIAQDLTDAIMPLMSPIAGGPCVRLHPDESSPADSPSRPVSNKGALKPSPRPPRTGPIPIKDHTQRDFSFTSPLLSHVSNDTAHACADFRILPMGWTPPPPDQSSLHFPRSAMEAIGISSDLLISATPGSRADLKDKTAVFREKAREAHEALSKFYWSSESSELMEFVNMLDELSDSITTRVEDPERNGEVVINRAFNGTARRTASLIWKMLDMWREEVEPYKLHVLKLESALGDMTESLSYVLDGFKHELTLKG